MDSDKLIFVLSVAASGADSGEPNCVLNADFTQFRINAGLTSLPGSMNVDRNSFVRVLNNAFDAWAGDCNLGRVANPIDRKVSGAVLRMDNLEYKDEPTPVLRSVPQGVVLASGGLPLCPAAGNFTYVDGDRIVFMKGGLAGAPNPAVLQFTGRVRFRLCGHGMYHLPAAGTAINIDGAASFVDIFSGGAAPGLLAVIDGANVPLVTDEWYNVRQNFGVAGPNQRNFIIAAEPDGVFVLGTTYEPTDDFEWLNVLWPSIHGDIKAALAMFLSSVVGVGIFDYTVVQDVIRACQYCMGLTEGSTRRSFVKLVRALALYGSKQ